MPKQTITITADDSGQTLTQFARKKLGISAREWQGLVRSQNIKINNRSAHSKKILSAGDILTLFRKEDTPPSLAPEKKALHILYEDDSCLVVNKPPFLLVHPTETTKRGTLSNFIAGYYESKGISIPVRPVHRLDRDTSGCILIAKTKEAQQYYASLLQKNELQRTYRLLTNGLITELKSPIEAPIGVDPRSPNRRKVLPNGKKATTFFKIIEEYKDNQSTLVEATIPTGRTHQIRVHFAHMGFPLLGDGMYGTRTTPYTRQCLHAYKLSFIPSKHTTRIECTAPLPENFGRENP